MVSSSMCGFQNRISMQMIKFAPKSSCKTSSRRDHIELAPSSRRAHTEMIAVPRIRQIHATHRTPAVARCTQWLRYRRRVTQDWPCTHTRPVRAGRVSPRHVSPPFPNRNSSRRARIRFTDRVSRQNVIGAIHTASRVSPAARPVRSKSHVRT